MEISCLTTSGEAYSAIHDDSYTNAQDSHRDLSTSFNPDFLPTGNTMPQAFPGGVLDPAVTMATSLNDLATFCDIDPSRAPYNYWDSFKDCLTGERNSQTTGNLDTAYNFLPSSRDVGMNDETMIPAISPRRIAALTSNGACGNNPRGNIMTDSKQRVERKRQRRRSTSTVSTTAKEKVAQCIPENERRRPTTQPHTALRASKRYTEFTAHKPAAAPEEEVARVAHNQAEQQYRKRLNAQFEMLLEVLPRPDYDEKRMAEKGVVEEGGIVGMEKKVSKAEVLYLARRRIVLLESEWASLMRQKKEIENKRRVEEC